MFDILKKKIAGFIDNLTKKETAREEVQIREEPKAEPEIGQKAESKIEKKEEPRIEAKIEKKAGPKHISKEVKKEIQKEIPKPPQNEELKKEELKIQPRAEVASKAKPQPEIKFLQKPEKKPAEVPAQPKPEPAHNIPEKKPETSEAKLGIFKQIKSIFTGDVEISRSDIVDLLDGLELEMLESDVAMDVAEEIRKDLEIKLIGNKIKKSELNSFIKTAIRNTLIEVMENEKIFDIVAKVANSEKPVKIMFLGINGSGKTTTIAKVAKLLMAANHKVVFAASDTFRAAAIEQLQVHADRLGVKMIKRDYGSDPTAVAYDAMSHATANKIDVVLIDTAGRQETNLNLINELKKMNRVIAPQLKIYIGESIAGNAIIQQVSEFNKEIGIDGVILTKLDCDAKGGTVISISKTTGIPIIYLGTGQKYADLEKFDVNKIVERILG